MIEIIKSITQDTFFPLFLGPFLGFSTFVVGLCTMEGIFLRPNAQGDLQFSMRNFIDYLKFPFNFGQRHIAWGYAPNISLLTRLKMLNLNWLAMVSIGSCFSFCYYLYC